MRNKIRSAQISTFIATLPSVNSVGNPMPLEWQPAHRRIAACSGGGSSGEGGATGSCGRGPFAPASTFESSPGARASCLSAVKIRDRLNAPVVNASSARGAIARTSIASVATDSRVIRAVTVAVPPAAGSWPASARISIETTRSAFANRALSSRAAERGSSEARQPPALIGTTVPRNSRFSMRPQLEQSATGARSNRSVEPVAGPWTPSCTARTAMRD